MTPEDDWQLGHRIAEPWGHAETIWELQPLSVQRPATGEATARYLCATCDEPVECVVVSADASDRRARQRRRRARVTTVIAATCGVVLAGSTLGGLSGAVIMAQDGEWALVAGMTGLTAVYGWFAGKAFTWVRPWSAFPPGDGDVRLAAPSPVHELRPPA
ncbi:hypothetical protein [Actinoplanes sp. CA-252034]|uniref:hypothetical protein n=1 Tax=Actinoplanes sp. CA-252034 TaxID=3239906 RepID=UPI003D98248A